MAARLTGAILGLASLPAVAGAAELPAFMQPIAGTATTTPTEVATQNVLALNTAMFSL